MQKLKDFRAGKPEGQGPEQSSATSAERAAARKAARRLPVRSTDPNSPLIKSPFAPRTAQTPANLMKASLVNNAIFHSQYDATLVEPDNIAVSN